MNTNKCIISTCFIATISLSPFSAFCDFSQIPFTVSSSKFEADIIEILIKYGGDPDLVIFKAANSGDIDSTLKLLDYGFSYTTNKIEPRPGKSNWNITDSACRSKSITLMNYLIEERKILPTRDHFTHHVKRENPDQEIIDFLLSKGYKFPSTIIFDAFYKSQYTDSEFDKAKEMHYTKNLLITPKLEFIAYLIESGAEIQDPKNNYKISFTSGMEYIWHALLHNMYVSKDPKTSDAWKMIQLLIAHGLEADIHSRGMPYTPFNDVKQAAGPLYCYTTPLGVAIKYEDIDFARLLLNAGADPKSSTNYYNWSVRPGSKDHYWAPGKAISLLDLAKKNKDMSRLLLEYWY